MLPPSVSCWPMTQFDSLGVAVSGVTTQLFNAPEVALDALNDGGAVNRSRRGRWRFIYTAVVANDAAIVTDTDPDVPVVSASTGADGGRPRLQRQANPVAVQRFAVVVPPAIEVRTGRRRLVNQFAQSAHR